MPLFYALLLAHLIADFLQPTALVGWTKRSVNGLLVHTTIYTLLSGIVLVGYNYWWLWLIILALTHFVVDRVKQLLSTKLSREGFYIFVADQIVHIGIMALVVFGIGLAKLQPSWFLRLISDCEKLLPATVGYVAGVFGVSILVFEAGRTFAPQSDNGQNNVVITFKNRLVGMIERALAISLILAHLYFLAPFCFVISIYQLVKGWKTSARKKLLIELSTSMFSTIAIGFAITFS